MQLHLTNGAFGLGDALVCLWVVQGLVDAGHEVFFYTHHHWQVTVFCQPGLEILPIEEARDDSFIMYGRHNEWKLTAGGKSRIGLIAARTLEYLRGRGASTEFTPTKPRYNLLPVELEGFVPGKTVFVFPHSLFAHREWAPLHWAHVISQLKIQGESVMVLTKKAGNYNFGCPTIQLPLQVIYSLLPQTKAILCVDSGSVHLAALTERPTFAVFAMAHPRTLCDYYKNVTPITPQGGCTFCHAQTLLGYNPSLCSTGCFQLNTVTPQQLLQAYEKSGS